MKRALYCTLMVCLTSCSSGNPQLPPGPPAINTPGTTALVKLSFDPYTNPTGQHETAMETNIVAHGNTLVAGYHIARLTTGGVTNIGWATSHDGGGTWQHGALSGTTTFAGGSMSLVSDPVVAYDVKHSVWMLSFVGLGATNAAYVSLSQDDGSTWSPPVVVASGNQPDKEWTACDNFPSSPHYGSCYTEYEENSGEAVFMTRSLDGGKTWEAPKAPADAFTGIAGQPTVLANGRVVVPISNSGFTELSVFASDDGGASWGASQPISTITTAPARAGLREDPNPSVTMDAAGKLYLTWYDCRFEASGCQTNGLVLSTSTDGLSWSAPTRIGTFPVSAQLDHVFPGVGADPSAAGKLGLVFYTVSAGACLTDATACVLDAYYASSADGGGNWSAPAHLGGPMKPEWISTTARGRLIGDYTGVALAGGFAFPAFSLALEPSSLPYNQAVYTFPQKN